ncbi:hypothetical protein OGAPHI_005474 [Ogataea philodendri]|uniref:DUF2423 domain-containing protein n=1 Tax=Ogataea philodendri TaxID=1378263 RepID=A0A9P8T204_9ASCO|nr:uncharacterized protein OGAPHI_005474 [Ogataea philodendri]KAH3662226.1 hypothetical protein OGAPHI_005474 [Ogataea philodendri]
MSVNLSRSSVFSKKTSQDSQSSHPQNLRWHSSLSSTLSLTVTHVSSTSSGLSQSSGVGSGVDGNWLLDNCTISEQFSDGLSRVGLGDLGGLVRVQPDLSLTTAQHRCCESLLSTMAHSARSKSKLKAKKEKVSAKDSDYYKLVERRTERLAKKLQEKVSSEDKKNISEEPTMEVDTKVSTSGWRSSRNNRYKKNHSSKRNKSIKF